jgi:hypothetical protein
LAEWALDELTLAVSIVPGAFRLRDVSLAIFTQNVVGPFFFETLQRKGRELDQMWRGVLWHRAFAG